MHKWQHHCQTKRTWMYCHPGEAASVYRVSSRLHNQSPSPHPRICKVNMELDTKLHQCHCHWNCLFQQKHTFFKNAFGDPYVTHHPKMRRFSKIMVVCFIAYLDRANSDRNNDTSTYSHITYSHIISRDTSIWMSKMQNVLIWEKWLSSFNSFICEDFTSCRHVLLQLDQIKYTIIMLVYIYAWSIQSIFKI